MTPELAQLLERIAENHNRFIGYFREYRKGLLIGVEEGWFGSSFQDGMALWLEYERLKRENGGGDETNK